MNTNIKMFSIEKVFCGHILQTEIYFLITTCVSFELIITVFLFGYVRDDQSINEISRPLHVRFKWEFMLWSWHSKVYSPVPYGTKPNLLSVCPRTGRVQNTCDFSLGQKREMCQRWICLTEDFNYHKNS